MYEQGAEPGRPAQDLPHAGRPIPPAASRQDALGQLRRERWHAEQAKEWGRVAEIDHQIERLSAQNAPVPPGRETTSAPARGRATTRRSTPS